MQVAMHSKGLTFFQIPLSPTLPNSFGIDLEVLWYFNISVFYFHIIKYNCGQKVGFVDITGLPTFWRIWSTPKYTISPKSIHFWIWSKIKIGIQNRTKSKRLEIVKIVKLVKVIGHFIIATKCRCAVLSQILKYVP